MKSKKPAPKTKYKKPAGLGKELARLKKRLEETAEDYCKAVDELNSYWEEFRTYLDDLTDFEYIPSPEGDSWITEMQLITDLLKIKCHQINDCLLSVHKQ